MIREVPVGASPLAHARYLHSEGKGDVTLCQKNGLEPLSKWNQYSYPVEKFYEIVPAYSGLDDVYISQNRFWGPRAVSRLAQLSALYVDVDYYKLPDLNGMHPLGVVELPFADLERSKVPRPSLAVATGRGLAFIWRHEPVPPRVLPKWNLCQDHIFEALKGLGADPLAKDAARVLRLVGSRNSKSGTIVEAIWEEHGEAIWDFGDLADEILPLTRRELEECRANRSENKGKLAFKDHRRASKSRDNIEKRFNADTLALGRLSDLQRLLRLRGYDKLPPGQRDSWMFGAATSLAYLVEPQFLERELLVLGKENADWSEAETRSRMQAVISLAHSAAAGDKVHWQGKQRDPRYRLTNQSLIEMLEITSEEERHLKTIISSETKRERDRQRKERERRSQGAQPREEYVASRRERRQHTRHEARKLRGEGKSLREIGRALGISHTQVSRLLDSAGGE